MATSCLPVRSGRSVPPPGASGGLPTPPEELDARRVRRAVAGRTRYRYVQPLILVEASGYRIVSPCCSRNVDPDGGLVDIAWLRQAMEADRWQLFSRDHEARRWLLQAQGRLHEVLEILRRDPRRLFWQ